MVQLKKSARIKSINKAFLCVHAWSKPISKDNKEFFKIINQKISYLKRFVGNFLLYMFKQKSISK